MRGRQRTSRWWADEPGLSDPLGVRDATRTPRMRRDGSSESDGRTCSQTKRNNRTFKESDQVRTEIYACRKWAGTQCMSAREREQPCQAIRAEQAAGAMNTHWT
eukprot:2340622-Pleurochrysis_carterae.AAC.1